MFPADGVKKIFPKSMFPEMVDVPVPEFNVDPPPPVSQVRSFDIVMSGLFVLASATKEPALGVFITKEPPTVTLWLDDVAMVMVLSMEAWLLYSSRFPPYTRGTRDKFPSVASYLILDETVP